MRSLNAIAVVAVGFFVGAVHAELEFSGYSGFELRAFTQDGLYPEQEDNHQFSTFGELELDYDLEQGELRFVGFGRADSSDSERSHIDVREAYWENGYGNVDVLIGINKVFWGVTESRHLVNIVNTVDAIENIDGEDYLGQPMLNLTYNSDYGEWGLFVLPYHRTTPFADERSRFRFGQLSIKDGAIYRNDADEDYVSAALRYSHYIGDWDFGLHYFHGVNREPTTFDPNGDISPVLNPVTGQPLIDSGTNQPMFQPNSLSPVYDVINQGGIDAQLTLDAWLYKLEAIWREGQGDTFAAATAGFEYSLYQVFDTDKDLGLLLEYSHDGREPESVINEDVFVGTRFSWNDLNDTSLLAGALTDIHDGSISFRIEAQRRIVESLTVEIEAQFFTHVDQDNPLATFEKDDSLAINIINYF